MVELNLKQIIDRLNQEFTGEVRKLIFWYDDNADFKDDISSVELENAKIYYLKEDNQFYTKYYLEKEDTITNYLIYAPFSKPDVKDNHLEDILLYSKRFYADRASLLSVDLGIDEKNKHVIEKHIKFFANKERTQRFYDLEIENFNRKNILVGLLSAICKTKICSFEEVLRIVLTDGEIEDNKFLKEMAKYDLVEDFWRLCEQQFGYVDDNPTLEKLIVTLFITYTDRFIDGEVPVPWRSFVSSKQGNIIAFLDGLMNNIMYHDYYNSLSEKISVGLKVENSFSKNEAERLVKCDTFKHFDKIIISWIIGRLINEDVGAKLNDLSIPELCDVRKKMHFGDCFKNDYEMLENAYYIISNVNYNVSDSLDKIIEQYKESDYIIDSCYRRFYYSLDMIEDTTEYESLQSLIENIYTNEYLNELLPKWNKCFSGKDGLNVIKLQRNFYRNFVNNTKEKTVVIISDAMRYEVGKELFDIMSDDPKCKASIDMMMSVLPSYTRLGMAALLPHSELEMTNDYKVLADNVLCNDLAGRAQVLKKYDPESACVQFDDIKSLKKQDLRDIFTGKQVVYVYHNQIDARGDESKTEDEVFNACREAVDEIKTLINRISTNANTYRFIITADHGFIYKRDKITESDKISGVNGKEAWINRRFIVSNDAINDTGVCNIGLGYILGNDDQKVISYPLSSNVFKVAGGGQNYVHGGSSPQEMLIPVIDIKMEKGHMETKSVSISLVSMIQKITNLITSMDFIQSEPVTDTMKSTTYRIYFCSEDGESISNECTYVADSRELDSQKRIFRLRFNFKNMKYDKDKQYYLIIKDDKNEIEIFRHAVIMDIAFADDFDF
ncbi:TIGR02687 family protein [Eubacterium uniforme]|uniref:TIGR02687 family protein n=1 Tax=Eubacterium uniforme TaxID=39495 RepID=A0A1T4VZJ1_9FIRM|nr:BREX-1 system phosphatase PglZ type A [Eubacterium uniforme]SKA70309.1 TIGR02687 family protein [Eubacterium uniforme]